MGAWSQVTGAVGAPVIPSQSRAPRLSGMSFAPGGDFTVGCEEELLLVDADDQLLAPGSGALVEALEADQGSRGVVTRELFAAEIEFATEVCQDADDVRTCLAEFRGSLGQAGGRAMGVGLHPVGEPGNPTLTAAPRYEAIGASLAGLVRTPTASLQVHVGMPDPATAIKVFRGLRHRLALFRALAAGSPYWHGRDSGYASGRWAVIQAYPRSGVPPVVHSWEEYVAVVDAVAAAAEVADYTHIWWDLRLQPRLGTIEVRAMDAQSSLSCAAGLVALVQALARCAVEQPLGADLPTEVLAENDFRVARAGLEARIVDVDGVMRPVRDLAATALDDARAVLAGDGAGSPLDVVEQILGDEPEYTRQRRIHSEHGMAALLRDLSTRTMQPT
jgi:carboxylate-amine ligase